MKKIFVTLVLLVAFTLSGTAQNKKLLEKANEKVEALNKEITSQDKSLALTDIQKEQISEAHLARLTESKALRKSGAEKADIKAVNKKYNQKIYKEILTKKQLKARRAGKKNDEDNDDDNK
ncbi:hypothetical protein EAX61_01855 [Dokdonia sinensis]|uniref:DUF4890 domain-containing protein n=1 Tax=Dokdonia sinensis TaxID=2479847 RepID=A0A3M0H385_9FLAO|nr:hypothetical protein [Dokdonia sinensis]RMB64146.1 hypothetical protein EAX61_01855 [Dokdonia sinensis]